MHLKVHRVVPVRETPLYIILFVRILIAKGREKILTRKVKLGCAVGKFLTFEQLLLKKNEKKNHGEEKIFSAWNLFFFWGNNPREVKEFVLTTVVFSAVLPLRTLGMTLTGVPFERFS